MGVWIVLRLTCTASHRHLYLQVYNEESIAAYWSDRPGELTSRWTKFAGVSGESACWPPELPPCLSIHSLLVSE